jgi:hypothetical protein
MAQPCRHSLLLGPSFEKLDDFFEFVLSLRLMQMIGDVVEEIAKSKIRLFCS